MQKKARPSQDGRAVCAALAFLVAGFAATSVALAQPVNDPAKADPTHFQALEHVCTNCHDTARVMHSRSWDEWMHLLGRMSEFGAKGTDQQWDDIQTFLAANLTLVNVNTASADELGPVLDVSEAVAGAIIARRDDHKFSGYADLAATPGINQKRLGLVKERLSF